MIQNTCVCVKVIGVMSN